LNPTALNLTLTKNFAKIRGKTEKDCGGGGDLEPESNQRGEREIWGAGARGNSPDK